ncbi:MAG TPA: hypothetical protein VEI97_18600 [bacterium]|nr:hypothetical protein [bacterium]
MPSLKPRDAVVCLVTDLFFVAKIEHPLQVLGLRPIFAKTDYEFLDALHSTHPPLAIIDLGAKGVDPIELIAQVRTNDDILGVPIIAFGSHQNTELMQAAEEAGADEVMPNSRFAAHLPTIVSQYLDQ